MYYNIYYLFIYFIEQVSLNLATVVFNTAVSFYTRYSQFEKYSSHRKMSPEPVSGARQQRTKRHN